MRKKAIALGLVLVFVLGVTVQAAPMRVPRLSPSLTFSGTIAICKATVRADNASDSILVTAKLWNGTTCLRTWTESGKLLVQLEREAPVNKGKTYKLTVDATINGVKQPTQSVSKTCP